MPKQLPREALKLFQRMDFSGLPTNEDLLAAFFFFSKFVNRVFSMINFLRKLDDNSLLKVFFKLSWLGLRFSLLSTLPWFFPLTALYTKPQEMLGLIATKSLGTFAAPCVCMAVIFALLNHGHTSDVIICRLFAH